MCLDVCVRGLWCYREIQNSPNEKSSFENMCIRADIAHISSFLKIKKWI